MLFFSLMTQPFPLPPPPLNGPVIKKRTFFFAASLIIKENCRKTQINFHCKDPTSTKGR